MHDAEHVILKNTSNGRSGGHWPVRRELPDGGCVAVSDTQASTADSHEGQSVVTAAGQAVYPAYGAVENQGAGADDGDDVRSFDLFRRQRDR